LLESYQKTKNPRKRLKNAKTIPIFMGADQPRIEKEPSEPARSGRAPFIVATLVLVAIALSTRLDLTKIGASDQLNPKEEAKLQKRLKEIDDSEQYALIAKMDGWYPCLHSERATCYLLAGEVWKYGVTSKGEFGRYSSMFISRNNVSYFIQFKGNMAECLKQEQIKLFNYPYLPENLARPPEDRLPRPPYNPIMR
jgi:hypothetical protein